MARRRDPHAESKERTGFIVLQHLHTLAEEIPTFSPERIASELWLEPEHVAQVLIHLATSELVAWCGAAGRVEITPAGVRYLESGAGRRRSARAQSDGRQRSA